LTGACTFVLDALEQRKLFVFVCTTLWQRCYITQSQNAETQCISRFVIKGKCL